MVLWTIGAVLFSLSSATSIFASAAVPLTFSAQFLVSGSAKTSSTRWWTPSSLSAGWWRYGVLLLIAGVRWVIISTTCHTMTPQRQAFWLASLGMSLTTWLAGRHLSQGQQGVSAVLAVFAQLFMTQAGVVYAASCERGAHDKNKYAAGAVVVLGFLWAFVGLAVISVSEHVPDATSRLLYYVFALASIMVGMLSTHGLGGRLRHGAHIISQGIHARRRSSRGASLVDQPSSHTHTPSDDTHTNTADDSSRTSDDLAPHSYPESPRSPRQQGLGWSFFQPFTGGTLFIATQGVGWAFFAACILLCGWGMYAALLGVAHCVSCWVLATGFSMFSAQLAVGTSVFLFKGGASATRKAAAATRRRWVDVWAHVMIMYTPLHVYFAAVACTCLLVPPTLAISGWAALHVLRVCLTAPLRPESTGACASPVFLAWLTQRLEPSLRAWFGSFEVVRDAAEAPDPGKRYVIGYHPHGLFPCGAGYLPLTPSWHRLMPGIQPATLTASVIFFPPAIRDLALATGLRQIDRATFIATLEEKRSVLVVPGGQAELVHTWRHRRSEFVTYSRHRGFVRLAMQQHAALIPVLAFGEVDSLGNLVNWPGALRWTYKRLGFPMPYFMVGRWGLSPFPSKTGLLFVIGAPLWGDQEAQRHGPVDDAAVEALHRRYYDELRRLFVKYKDRFPGYACMEYVEER